MNTIKTGITRLLNIRTPVIAAPMAGASGGALAAQVSRAGGFGFIAGGYDDAATFKKELELASSILQTNRNSSSRSPGAGAGATSISHSDKSDPLKIGVGFMGWKLDEPDGKSSALLRLALDARVSAIWLSFGNDLGKWVRLVRQLDGERSKPHKTLVFVLVNSLQEARVAVEEWQADVLVAQGIESGGHGHGSAPPLLTLVPEILNAFSNGSRGPSDGGPHARTPCPPVLAAGGLSTGAHVASLLTLGASGVALGTRFLLTPEARYTAAQKAALLAAHATSTVRTTAFDVARGTLGWPSGVDGRALRNQTVKNIEEGMSIEDAKQHLERSTRENDADGMVIWSGTGISLVNEVKPASDIVAELHVEMLEHLRAAHTLLTPD